MVNGTNISIAYHQAHGTKSTRKLLEWLEYVSHISILKHFVPEGSSRDSDNLLSPIRMFAYVPTDPSGHLLASAKLAPVCPVGFCGINSEMFRKSPQNQASCCSPCPP